MIPIQANITIELEGTKEFNTLMVFVIEIARGKYREAFLACEQNVKKILVLINERVVEEVAHGD